MVVVLVVIAHAPAATAAAVVGFRVNRRAWNMAEIVMDAAGGIPDSSRQGVKPAL